MCTYMRRWQSEIQNHFCVSSAKVVTVISEQLGDDRRSPRASSGESWKSVSTTLADFASRFPAPSIHPTYTIAAAAAAAGLWSSSIERAKNLLKGS